MCMLVFRFMQTGAANGWLSGVALQGFEGGEANSSQSASHP
jgi:hypothetical protein